jgi:RND family efflux transporter MFP subunit
MKRGIFIVAALGTAACSRQETGAHLPQNASPVVVRTAPVARVEWPSVYERTGTVQARTSTVVSSRVMAYVRELPVNVGDRVIAGQVLAVLDSRDLEAQKRAAMAVRDEAQSATVELTNAIASAQATLQLTKATHGRMADLFAKTSISSQEMDEANAKLKVAQAQYDAAQSRRAQLDLRIRQADEGVRNAEVMAGYTRVVAPFAGLVIEKPGQPGMLAAPGTPLFTIQREGEYRVEVPVEQALMSSIHTGQPVEIELDGAGPRFTSTVVEIVPALDTASHSFIAKVSIPPGRMVRSGMFARVGFAGPVDRVIAISPGSTTGRGGLPAVFVADNGIARLRLITLGREMNSKHEVLSGLNEGDLLITPIPPDIHDGLRIEAKQ